MQLSLLQRTAEAIQMRAYEFFIKRGSTHGDDLLIGSRPNGSYEPRAVSNAVRGQASGDKGVQSGLSV